MRTPSGFAGGWGRTSRLGAVIGVCLLAAVACSSKSSKSPSTASSHPAAATTSASVSATPSSGFSGAALQISQVWARFFAGTTSASDKQGLLENGSAFAAAIAAQADSPMAKGTRATVSKVTMTSADKAEVTYTISIAGLPVLANQTGTAVLVNGAWKVGAASFCQLLSLEGQAPSACPAASAPASS